MHLTSVKDRPYRRFLWQPCLSPRDARTLVDFSRLLLAPLLWRIQTLTVSLPVLLDILVLRHT